MSTLWSIDECRVLVAVYINSSLSIGDDGRNEAREIVDAFKRSPSSIDRQWRNIQDILRETSISNVGARLKRSVYEYLQDPMAFRKLALYLCDRNNWPLELLIVGGEDDAGLLVEENLVNRELGEALCELFPRMEFHLFPSRAQGLIVESGVRLSSKRCFWCSISVVADGSRRDAKFYFNVDQEKLRLEASDALRLMRGVQFQSGRQAFYLDTKVWISEQQYNIRATAQEVPCP